VLCQCYPTRKYFLARVKEGNPAGPGTFVQTPQYPRANLLQRQHVCPLGLQHSSAGERGEAGTQYKGPSVLKGARAPNILHMFLSLPVV